MIKHYSIYFFLLIQFMLGISSYAQTVSVNLSDEHQIIRGFGGVNMPGWIKDLNEDQTNKAFGNAPGQMGLSILRLRVPNDTARFELEVRTAAQAAQLGATIFGSPWSPPGSLKSNNNTTGGYLLPANYRAYTDHLLSFTKYMEERGAPVYAVSVQNEPDIQVDYESCDWTSSQMANYIKQEGERFGDVKLIAPESWKFSQSFADALLNNATVEPHLDIIGGHIYRYSDHTKDYLNVASYQLAAAKGKEVWMTEHYLDSDNSGNKWPMALLLGNEIAACMKANHNAYVWWYIRRFYGLIDESGNITKRGYMMAHFSKFVRPGAQRIGCSLSSVSNVDATAFKTDTSLVVVLINNNSATVSFDLNIPGSHIIELTKLTTSRTKNMINEGTFMLENDALKISLEGNSIATLTSNAANAGKKNNANPKADAGADQTINDSDGNGFERVQLNGTGSNDTDGSIVNYSWALNNEQIAWSANPEIELQLGINQITLTVTDNDGATSTDMVTITVASPYNTEIWMEAECSTVGENWEVKTTLNASNNKYITALSGVQSNNNAAEQTAFYSEYSFSITEPSSYLVWARIMAPSYDDDSFWIRMDNGEWIMWNGLKTGEGIWAWKAVNNNAGYLRYELGAGEHTLYICLREDGACLDKVAIINTGTEPVDMGGVSETCTDTGISESSVDQHKLPIIYPNPVSNELNISLSQFPSQVTLLNSNGAIIFSQKSEVDKMTINMTDYSAGFYFVKIENDCQTILREVIK